MTVSPRHAWHVRTEGLQLTAFDPRSGARLSFGPTPARLRAPELLDVKLTDVCSVGCAFCYQDSRSDRRHARLEDVALIAAEAGRSGVFEVALGGGEVSEYPHFHEVLYLFRAAGVVPNLPPGVCAGWRGNGVIYASWWAAWPSASGVRRKFACSTS